jgi:hypothetical protein
MLYIFGRRNVAQIFYPIIAALTVYMVDIVNGPSFINIKPRKPMRSVTKTIKSYYYIPLIVYSARTTAYDYSAIIFNFPQQIAGFWNIIQKRCKFFVCYHVELLVELSYANINLQSRMKAP